MPSDRTFFGHPVGLSTLFFTEMWERFSYYGMRAILILFMVAPPAEGGLGFSVAQGGAVQGTYSAMVYMATLAGGWFADKLLGLRRSVFWGGVLIMLGHISLALPNLATFYLGLLLVVLGTGLLKGNVSAMVGQLYRADDIRREAGYSVYYMGVNLGGFLGPLVCGFLAQQPDFRAMLERWGMRPEQAWHFGFGAAALGMFLGLIQYQLGRRHLPPEAERPLGVSTPEEAASARRRFITGSAVTAIIAVGLILLSRAGILNPTPGGVATAIDIFLAIVVIGVVVWLYSAGQWTPEERKRLMVVLVLFLGSSVFWAGFEQTASTLNLFAQRNTATSLFGWQYPPSWLQSVNSFFIIVFAPIVGAVWLKLGTRNPSSPAKFALGLFLLSLSYGLMIVAAMVAGETGRVSPMWLIGCYFLQTIGELALSPVGMSAMSTLAPTRVSGLMMGVWFLTLAVGNKVAGRMGGLYESLSLPTLFGVNAAFVAIFAVVIALLIVPMKRMLARPAVQAG
jgi:proton-dependent oligopeptide transporter, POT family